MLTLDDLVPQQADRHDDPDGLDRDSLAADGPDGSDGLQLAAPPELPLLAVAAPRRARRVLRPALWLLAVGYLAFERVGEAIGEALEGYVRATDAVGRWAASVGRTVLRWLGPLGRLLRRLSAPLVRLLTRCWDRVSVWLMLRMFRPLHRWLQRLWSRCRPVLERLVTLLDPALRALTGAVDAVEAAAARLAARCRRVWAPVVRLARELRRPRRS